MVRFIIWRCAMVALLIVPAASSKAQIQPAPAGIAAQLAQQNFPDAMVREFYQARQFAPAWSGSPSADVAARQALAALSRAGEEGLAPDRYSLFHVTGGNAAASDIALTAAVFAYMNDSVRGRPELEGLDADVALPSKPFDADAALSEALRQGGLDRMLANLSPSDPQFMRLKSALANYRQIVAKGGWPALALPQAAEPDGNTLLWQRLAFEDSSLGDALNNAELSAATRQFQTRHGLDPDGVVGKQTLAALNIPAAERADSIVANMERWRWLPRVWEPDRIVINTAEAQLEMWLGGRLVLTSKVVVGRRHDPTPILRAEGAGLTVNPPWTVPASIAAREILPKLKANPSYLASQDMILVNGPSGDPQGLHVNWRAIRAGTFPYQIRQYPGPNNPLGQVKLELPNTFDVYLHDTPTKSAFARDRRDLSHGCVRVEQILPLASLALNADLSAVDMIVQAIGTGETKYMPLSKKLPVYFLYWTAFADADGRMNFRTDIYGRDQRLIKALASRPVRLASAIAGCAKGPDLSIAGGAPT